MLPGFSQVCARAPERTPFYSCHASGAVCTFGLCLCKDAGEEPPFV